jgi:[ribosomal protein S18]-alanine N-acetyltransferase
VSLCLRPARAEDAPILQELEHECFTDPSWDAEEFLRYPCTVAEVEGRIAGFVVIRRMVPGVQGHPEECEILNIAVSPANRGLGIATALLRYELRPGATYYLEVRESNTAARKLYEKLGFTQIGSRKNYYDNPSETAIVMCRK